MRDLLRYKYNAGLNFFGVLDEKYYLGSDSWRGHIYFVRLSRDMRLKAAKMR